MLKSPKLTARSALTALLLGCTMMLTACGWEGTGDVVNKTHRAAHYEWYQQCMSYRDGLCTRYAPQQRWVSAVYRLIVEDTEGETHSVRVTEATYDKTEIGDTFDNRKGK